MSWFVKVIRSGARDANGDLPAEVWSEGEVIPTLNQFDNTGESRATVIIFEATRVNDVRIYEDKSPTVATYWGTGGSRVPYVHRNKQLTVRRLTPTECERLQGFPDGWTEGQTDGHRYKQMGNAVAVPVVEWIMERLVTCDKMVVVTDGRIEGRA